MLEQTPISIVNFAEFQERRERRYLENLHAGPGLEAIDCADDRNLTAAMYRQRAERFNHHVIPGRVFGAASGYALGTLITLAAQLDEKQLAGFVRDYSAEAFVDFAADISDRAHNKLGQDLVQHSGELNEQDPLHISDSKELVNPLGCAFALNAGLVAINCGRQDVTAEAERVQATAGITKPLQSVQRGAQILANYLPEGFGVHRGALVHAVKKSPLYTPTAIVSGPHAPNIEAAVDYDFAGVRSDAAAHNTAGIHRYHHTPLLIAEQVPKLLPEFKLDPDLLYAAGILMGAATRYALSGPERPHDLRVGVIPQEYANVA